MATTELPEKPSDDELAQWHEGYLGCSPYDAETIPGMRAAIKAKTFTDAVCELLDRGWAGPKCEPLARALRRRFPQPITDAVLRAEGFDRCATFDGDWVLAVSDRIVAFYRTSTDSLTWFRQWKNRDGLTTLVPVVPVDLIENVRTPDRLHDVRVALETLYAPGEDA